MNTSTISSHDFPSRIPGPAGELEFSVTLAEPDGELSTNKFIAVICHPHPVYGGTMNNKVVTTLMRSYRDLGVPVVRFNFRGVGKSTGSFAHGAGELDDLIAVLAWVESEFPESDPLLAGFSFGSAIAARASYRCARLRHLLLVAPPIERYDYDSDGQFGCPVCVVQGDRDERVNAEGVYAWVASLTSPTELIRYDKATHFFHGYLTQMKADVTWILLAALK